MEKISHLDADFRYKSDVEDLITEFGLPRDGFCLVGSMSLAVRGLREAGDLDLCGDPEVEAMIESIDLPSHVDFHTQRYEKFGLSNEEIVHNPKYHDVLDGIKIVRPELKFSTALSSMREKDRMDVVLLEEYAFNNPDDWDWDLVSFEAQVIEDNRSLPILAKDFTFSLKARGLKGTAREVLTYLRDNTEINISNKIKPTLNYLSTPRYKYGIGHRATNDLHLSVKIDELLASQFTEDGFQRYDLVARSVMQSTQNSQSIDFEQICEKIFRKNEWDNKSSAGEVEYGKNVSVETNSGLEIVSESGLSTALTNGVPYVPVVLTSGNPDFGYDENWLRDSGLSDDELRVLRDRLSQFMDEWGLKHYIIIWPEASEYFDEIEAACRERLHVLESESVKIEDFEGFLRKVYAAHNATNSWQFERKVRLLGGEPKTVRVLAVNVHTYDGDGVEHLNDTKLSIREEYKDVTGDDRGNIILHSTEFFHENRTAHRLLEQYR